MSNLYVKCFGRLEHDKACRQALVPLVYYQAVAHSTACVGVWEFFFMNYPTVKDGGVSKTPSD